MLERIIPFSHKKIKEYLNDNSITIDMTMGNGNDTLFLSSLSSFVYAFDIQEMALKNTEKLLKDNNVENVQLIMDSHINVKEYVKNADCAVFNLGYLPGSDQTVTTKKEDTIKAINELLDIINPKGLIAITVYIGHEQGNIESEALLEYLTTLSSKRYNVLKYQFINKKNSPYNIFIEKLRWDDEKY